MITLPFAQLAWKGAAVTDGPAGFLVLAPWCEDCQEAAPHVPAFLQQRRDNGLPADRIWIVCEFTPSSEARAFVDALGWSAPLLFGSEEKSKTAWNQAYFRLIRSAFGDERRWGLPFWIEGTIRDGALSVLRTRTAV